MQKIISFLLLITLFSPLKAQHPYSTKWKTIKTERLKVIYPENLSSDAYRLALSIDSVYKGDTHFLYANPRRVPLVLSATTTISNGYATLFPYHSMFYSKPFDDCSLGSGEWFENLAVHEYRHIVQYDVLNHGFTKLASCLFGAYGRSTLSYSVPQWFYEGDAVFAETVLTSQGRGRCANFDRSLAAIICEKNKFYKFDKMVLRSYRDFIPSHYPLGYLLVTKARKDFGEDIFYKTAKRSCWYSFFPYAFSIGFRHFTDESFSTNYKNAFSELKTFYNKRQDDFQAIDYQNVNTKKKRYYTNYDSPHFINDSLLICLKSSLSKPARFVLLTLDGKEKELDFTDASGFDTDGKILIYSSEVPDLRWSLRDFSDIALYDIKSGKRQLITKKQKYFSPVLSPDSKKIVAIEFNENRECKIVVLELEKQLLGKYSTKVIKTFTAEKNAFLRSPDFLNNEEIVFVKNYDNKNSVNILNLNDLTTQEIIPPTKENLDKICCDNGRIFYVSDITGIENVFEISLNDKKISQITNTKFGISDLDISDNSLIISDFNMKGNDVSLIKDYEPFEVKQSKPLNYFSNVLEKNPRENLDFIATLKPDTTILKSKRYGQFNDPIRIYGWLPNAYGNIIEGTVFSQNTLGTLYLRANETYNTDLNFFRTNLTCLYTGFYPEIQFSASLGENADYYTKKIINLNQNQKVKVEWKENIYGAYVTLPLNFSRFNYSRKLSLTGGILVYSLSDKTIASIEDMPEGNFGVWNYSLMYSWSKSTAYRDFKNPLSYNFSISQKKSLSEKLDAQMFAVNLDFTVPGFFRQNYFSVSLDHIRQTQKQEKNSFLFSSQAFNIRGYDALRMQKFSKLSANYSFPLGYPDFGIPALVWVKRFRGSIFTNLAKGEILGFSPKYFSLGGEIVADFHLLRLPNVITAGFSFAKGLKENGFQKNDFSIILSYQL